MQIKEAVLSIKVDMVPLFVDVNINDSTTNLSLCTHYSHNTHSTSLPPKQDENQNNKNNNPWLHKLSDTIRNSLVGAKQ